MPATSFTAAWTTGALFLNPPGKDPPAPAKRRPQPVPCVCPHCKAGLLVSGPEVVIVARPKPKRPKKPRLLAELSPAVYELIDQRIQDAVDAGTIDVLVEAEDVADTVAITYGELNRLRMIALADGFRPNGVPRPCPHPPGSAAKVEEMERRAAAGLPTTTPLDADPDGDARGGTEVIGTGRGGRLKVEVIG